MGIYCNKDWYNNVLTAKLRSYDCWLASYPANDSGALQERLRPSEGIGWQYSEKGNVSGITGNVDMNVFYTDYREDAKMTKTEAINMVIGIAEEEIGYLEKKSNSQLDDKTANAGSANYTKYWRDIKPSYQAQPWCAAFISWCFMKAFGLETAKKMLKHWPYVYCPTLGNLFTKNTNPTVGDIVIFKNNETFTHTGLVTKVSGDKFWTIEGNTSGASGIVANGGGVCSKYYYNSKLPGTKFCTPDYSIAAAKTKISTNASTAPSKTSKWVGKVTATELNVRTWAGTENAKLKSYPTLKKGNLVDVCDTIKDSEGADWYYVRIAGKYFGFVSGKYIKKA